jgi:hypothetical protein
VTPEQAPPADLEAGVPDRPPVVADVPASPDADSGDVPPADVASADVPSADVPSAGFHTPAFDMAQGSGPAAALAAAPTVTAGPARPADRWRLEDQADFYRRSLADAEVEHEAGDLADDDYEVLVRRDRGRLATVEAELDRLDRDAASAPVVATGAEDGDGPGRGVADPGGEGAARAGSAGTATGRRHRRAFLVVGLCALAAAGAVVLILHLIAPSLPGQPFSGSTTVNLAQKIQEQLTQADQMVADDNLTGALAVYQEILGEEPHQAAALTERGWLEYAAGVQTGDVGLIRQGRASILEAQAVDPAQATPHLLLGIIDLQRDNDARAAVAQFTKFLADGPTASDLAQGAPYMRRAYALAGLPVPAQVPAATG